MLKAPYDNVTLRVTWHGLDPCEIGDELVTRTGRRYQVLAISGKRFQCMVLPKDASVQSNQWALTWNSRKKQTG
jgi:hypothetical protein